jgi:hypothetical protein
VHIPKTGGTSITKALKDYGLLGEGHHSLREIRKIYNISIYEAAQYFKFAVVRNPWDIVVSNFHYSRMKKSFWHSDDETTKWSIHPDYNLASQIEFEQYVQLLVGGKLNHRFAAVPQSFWIDGDVDYLIRFENLNNDFSKVCQQIGLEPAPLEKINPSKHKHYSTYYTDESKKLIEEYYHQDIVRFNYRFEGVSL